MLIEPFTLFLVVKKEVGCSLTKIARASESKHPSEKLLITVTVNVPSSVYVFEGLILEEVVPSPNVHVAAMGVGTDVFSKIQPSFKHMVSAAENELCLEVIIASFEIVSTQP